MKDKHLKYNNANHTRTIEPEGFYHVYNHAVGKLSIFTEVRNYNFFLERHFKYISPIADTLVYCMMPNHFHFLVFPKAKPEEINKTKLEEFLQNAYTNAYNKTCERRGALHCQSLNRELIKSVEHIHNLIPYIHFNPVTHGFVKSVMEWEYFSFQHYLPSKNGIVDLQSDLFL